MVAHNVLCHSNAHTQPRPVAYENKYVNVKRVFNTQPEVMGFVICVGEAIHERMLKKPMMTVPPPSASNFAISSERAP